MWLYPIFQDILNIFKKLIFALQCNKNIFEYSIIQILGTEYWIFKYEYSIFWLWIYSIFVFGLVANNKYIRYSYLVCSRNIQYSYSVKSFINMFLFIGRQKKSLGTCINMHQNLFKIYFMVEGGHQMFAFYIFDIHIRMKLFDICIQSGA